MFKDHTSNLDDALGNTRPDDIQSYIEGHKNDLADKERPFAAYMREMFKIKEITQQEVFLKADMPERYAYKLIAQTKKTTRRDYILRFCFAAGFTLKETQRALKLYGMSELYARIPRDAALIVAFNTGVSEVSAVNDILTSNGMETLKMCTGSE